MLVVTRKVGERIQIGDSITVMVVRINGPAVRLGVEAPPNLAIVREELVQNEARAPASKTAEQSAHT
jgi:carbon storage regulator